MPGGGGGIGEESWNGFSITEWAENQGGKVESLTWQIEGEYPEEWYRCSQPDNRAPIIVCFDAQKKTLYINLEMAKKFGMEVEIIPTDDMGSSG